MPPRRFSRHSFTATVQETDLRLVQTDREIFRFSPRRDNRTHVVKQGESLFTIAAKMFPSFDRPAGLWWILADFQPDPIQDPTLALEPGRTLFIPSEAVVVQEIFSQKRRDLET